MCFSIKDKEQNKIILTKLRNLKTKLDNKYKGEYTIHSCHLPKKIVLEKGFDQTISNGFVDIFGDKYCCEVTGETFEQAMKEMNTYRIATAQKVDRLIVISDQPISNISLELEYFTNKKIMCI